MPNLPLRGRSLLAALLALGVLAWVSADSAPPGSDDRQPPGDACGPALAKPGGGTWQCTFVDEFDGDALDTDKWTAADTTLTGFRTGLTCYRGAANVAVRDGTLLLEARDAGVTLDCATAYGPFPTRYSGGLVTTRGHFSQAYGRFEVRAKYPTARTPGVHGGFWMFPLRPTYGRWPASGEIDVAEWWSNHPNLVLPSLHHAGRVGATDTGWGCRVADVSTFHTYTAEWSATEIRVFIDGTLCFERAWVPALPLLAPQPFDQPFSMILNMGVGQASGPNAVSSATELPATYVVDYAKAWR